MDLKIVKNIYEKMADQKSRQIFVNRLLYSITEHPFYLQNVIKASTRGNAFITKIEKASGALVLFGAEFGEEKFIRRSQMPGGNFGQTPVRRRKCCTICQ